MRSVPFGLGAELQPAQTCGALSLLQKAHGLLSDEDIVMKVEVIERRARNMSCEL